MKPVVACLREALVGVGVGGGHQVAPLGEPPSAGVPPSVTAAASSVREFVLVRLPRGKSAAGSGLEPGRVPPFAGAWPSEMATGASTCERLPDA